MISTIILILNIVILAYCSMLNCIAVLDYHKRRNKVIFTISFSLILIVITTVDAIIMIVQRLTSTTSEPALNGMWEDYQFYRVWNVNKITRAERKLQGDCEFCGEHDRHHTKCKNNKNRYV